VTLIRKCKAQRHRELRSPWIDEDGYFSPLVIPAEGTVDFLVRDLRATWSGAVVAVLVPAGRSVQSGHKGRGYSLSTVPEAGIQTPWPPVGPRFRGDDEIVGGPPPSLGLRPGL